MARVKVTEPRTGSVVEVDSKSPLAKQWGTAEEPKKSTAKSSSSKSSK